MAIRLGIEAVPYVHCIRASRTPPRGHGIRNRWHFTADRRSTANHGADVLRERESPGPFFYPVSAMSQEVDGAATATPDTKLTARVRVRFWTGTPAVRNSWWAIWIAVRPAEERTTRPETTNSIGAVLWRSAGHEIETSTPSPAGSSRPE